MKKNQLIQIKNGSSTVDHKYHVHSNPIKFGKGKVDCKTTGGHYNPLKVK